MARIIVNEGAGPRSIALSAKRIVVGSNPICDVILAHPSALGVRFTIEGVADGHRVEVIKGVVLHNEKEVTSALLAHNDTLRVGESMVLFKEAALAGTGSAALPPDVGRARDVHTDRSAGLLDAQPPVEDVTVDEAPAAQPRAEAGPGTEALDELDEVAELEESEELEELEELEEPEAPEESEALDALGPASRTLIEDELPLQSVMLDEDADEDAEEDTGEEGAPDAESESPPDAEADELPETDGVDEAESSDEAEASREPVLAAVAPSAASARAEPLLTRSAPARHGGPIRFRRPLPPGCKAPTSLPPAHPGRPPR
jgi:hypothetical protein